MIKSWLLVAGCWLWLLGCSSNPPATHNVQPTNNMSAIDPMTNTPPVVIPPADLPVTVPFRIVITTNVANPSTSATLTDGAVVQGLTLSTANGDVVLLIGQTDPAENGFWLVGETGGERFVAEGFFSDNIGPSGEQGHYRQFKSGIHEGTNGQWDSTDPNYSTGGEYDPTKTRVGKSYCLATPTPALFEDGLQFVEVKEGSPSVAAADFDDTAPGSGKTNSHTPTFSNTAPGQHP